MPSSTHGSERGTMEESSPYLMVAYSSTAFNTRVTFAGVIEMFDDVLREARRLESGVLISNRLPLDDNGYLDRLCPNIQCQATFKVRFEDWRDKVCDEVVYCPLCRSESESSNWNTADQQAYIEQVCFQYLEKSLGKAFEQSVRQFNRSQRSDGLIQMSMSYRPGASPILIPIAASEIMRQQTTCEKCGCRYSSIGAAFFCPACGHNSASSTFDAAVVTVRETIHVIPAIRQLLMESSGEDSAANAIRQILENALVKLVSSFERFTEAHFDSLPNRNQFNPRRSVFQTLSEASGLWLKAIGHGYEDMLTAPDYSNLNCYFQQRHLLVHKEAMVDRVYLDKTSDRRYAVGQRLVIREEAVLELANLVSKLAQEIRDRS